jgi:hypothetical protein
MINLLFFRRLKIMELLKIYELYKVKKVAFEKAKKEEEKYKSLLKEAMTEAGVKEYTDTEGYKFECFQSSRKSLDEPKLLDALHSKGLTDCIKTVEAVDEEATLTAVNEGRLEQETLAECLKVTNITTLKLTAPKTGKK